MHPHELPVRVGVIVQPAQRPVHDRPGGHAVVRERFLLGRPRPGRFGIGVESLLQTVLFPHDECRREARGRESGIAQHLGQGDGFGTQTEDQVVAHPVILRVDPGEDRAVRGERGRHRRHRVLEQRGLAGQGVKVGGRGGRVTVATQTVGSRRVESDDDDTANRLPPAATTRGRDADQGGRQNGPPSQQTSSHR